MCCFHPHGWSFDPNHHDHPRAWEKFRSNVEQVLMPARWFTCFGVMLPFSWRCSLSSPQPLQLCFGQSRFCAAFLHRCSGGRRNWTCQKHAQPTELESFEGLSHFISNLFRTCQSAVQAMMADIEAIVKTFKTDPLFSPSRIIQRRTSQLHQVQHRDLEHKGIFTCAMVNAGDSDTVLGDIQWLMRIYDNHHIPSQGSLYTPYSRWDDPWWP